MAIYKILTVKNYPYEAGKRTVIFVSEINGEKRKCILGDLPDDNAQARDMILAREQELFDIGKPWEDLTSVNIESPAKDFLYSLPDLATANTAIDNISSLAEAKPILKKMVKAIFALKEVAL